VSDYGAAATHLRLEYADDDARDVAAALAATQSGLYAQVNVQTLIDGTVNWPGMVQGFETMREAMRRNPSDDLAVVLFSGHGAVVDEGFYLLPHGVDARSPALLRATAIEAGLLRREIAGLAEHGRVLVLLDACRSGATLDGRDFAANADLLRASLRGLPNVTIVTSSAAGELSAEGDAWGNGAFTEAFLTALAEGDRNGNGVISGEELTGAISEQMASLAPQTPGVDMRFGTNLFAVGLRTAEGDWTMGGAN
jgi:hypothetical protein